MAQGSDNINIDPGTGDAPGWMIAFTDLLALMLTFFVLMFSMSEVQTQRWDDMAGALRARLNPSSEIVKNRDGQTEAVADDTSALSSGDMSYLRQVIVEKFRRAGLLDVAVVQQEPDRLVVSFPGEFLFKANGTSLTDKANASFLVLAEMVDMVSNPIVVNAHLGPKSSLRGYSSARETSLVQAQSVVTGLARSGLTRKIPAFGLGTSRYYDLDTRLSAKQNKRWMWRADIVLLSKVSGNSE